jgi:hypothetical protein
MVFLKKGIRKINDTLAYRLPVLLFKKWVTYISPFRLSTNNANPNFNLVTLCGARDYPLLKEALSSIGRSFDRLPHLYIFTDFGTPDEIIEKISAWYPSNLLHIIRADQCIQHHEEKGNVLIKDYALKSPMGLKLAAIVQIAELGLPLFYADTDVLWFNDPSDDVNCFMQSGSNIHMSYDYHPGYDYDFIDKANLGLTIERPHYNAGLIFIRDITPEQRSEIERLLPFVIAANNNLSEQTIFAYLQKGAGISEMSPEKFLLFHDDEFDVFPSWRKGTISRHYIAQVRHLFWRDAFFIRWRHSRL